MSDIYERHSAELDAQARQSYGEGWRDAVEECARVAEALDPDRLICINGHDRCDGPDEECPYCEIRSPIAAAIRDLKSKESGLPRKAQ